MCKKLPQPDKSRIKLNHLQSDWYNDEQRPLVGCYEPEVDVTLLTFNIMTIMKSRAVIVPKIWLKIDAQTDFKGPVPGGNWWSMKS